MAEESRKFESQILEIQKAQQVQLESIKEVGERVERLTNYLRNLKDAINTVDRF